MSINFRLGLLAVILPLLLVMVIGIRDVGRALWLQSNLDEAAFQGLEWATSHGYDLDGIVTAAQATAGVSNSAVAAHNVCACTTGRSARLARCDIICSDGRQPEHYFVVTALMCYRPTLAWPGVAYCSANNSQCAAAACTSRQILLGSQSVALQ